MGLEPLVIALGRVTHVGGDAKVNLLKRSEETVFLSIWCQRVTQAVSPVKERRGLESVQLRPRKPRLAEISAVCPVAETGHNCY